MAYDEYWHEHNVFYFKIATWQRKFSLFPHLCQLTGRLIWLRPAMLGVRIIKGPGSDVVERYWVDEGEFFLHKLRYGY